MYNAGNILGMLFKNSDIATDCCIEKSKYSKNGNKSIPAPIPIIPIIVPTKIANSNIAIYVNIGIILYFIVIYKDLHTFIL